ncbi:helix-turn-helix domain-containing protein [Kushneria aurantia]|uniref:Helix-turn-helix domain-containing protein n=1 Tax=Kushneria aurantia TaxID=504092 RepID=A0ABV6G0A1_9GAMM|nr:helix-turn-helix domain-containing protein [Kushneria aurantia]
MSLPAEDMPHLAHFVTLPPSPALAAHVQCFWWLRGFTDVDASVQLLHPDGGSGIIFNFADPLGLNDRLYAHRMLICGPQMATTRLRLPHRVDLLGVRLQPGRGAHCLGSRLDRLCGYQGHDSAEARWQRLTDRLAEADRTIQQRLIEAELLTLVQRPLQKAAPVKHLLHLIAESRGQRRILELMQGCSISQRQLERLFLRQVGLTPKQYSRTQRVALVRHRLKAGTGLLATALACGYSDQAHCIHDFSAVVGMTPGQYRRRALSGRPDSTMIASTMNHP